jgi:branched-chain amino acid transport system ATP-binding protein
MALLELDGVAVHYGRIQALADVSVTVDAGEIVALIGANGAGKTTTMRAISGLRPLSAGRVVFDGQDITGLRADLRVRRGICQSPEGRGVFPGMTVMENLDMGAYTRKDRRTPAYREDLDRVFELFPRLAERRNQPGGTLSGGEQQMVAIGRALMARPRLLMLDEPSLGLAPVMVGAIFANLAAINRDGLTILLVEQNVLRALRVSQRAYVLENGAITLAGPSATLLADERVRRAYLG